MLLASLIDAADDPDTFLQELITRIKLGIPDIAQEWDLTTKKVVRSAGCIAARKVDVYSVFGHKSAPVPSNSPDIVAVEAHSHEHGHAHAHGHDHDQSNHSHAITHDHSHEHSHSHAEKEDEKESQEQTHDHSHEQHSSHNHSHEHSHAHVDERNNPLRNLPEITRLITQADTTYIPHTVKELTIAAFTSLAHAEAKTHGTDSIDQVHFHEVGAIDSIIDTLGTILALHTLGVTTISCSKLPLGEGTVMTQHGLLPVPAPAALRLMVGFKSGTCPGPRGVTGELVTPTAAALLRALTDCRGLEDSKYIPPGRAPAMMLCCVGLGAGSKDFPGHANVVRVLIGDTDGDGGDAISSSNHIHGSGGGSESSEEAPRHHDHHHDHQGSSSSVRKDNVEGQETKVHQESFSSSSSSELTQQKVNGATTTASQTDALWNTHKMTLFAANIDDTTPEILSYTMNQLLKAGAVDAWVNPIVMKKGRSAHCINYLMLESSDDDNDVQKMESELLQIIFRETSTLGIRIQRNIERAALPRSFISVKVGEPSANRTVKVKIGKMIGASKIATLSAEFEDSRAVAEESGVPLKVVMDEAIRAARVKLGLEF